MATASTSPARPVRALLPLALLGCVALFVAGFVAWIVGARIGYPYELEWMEGAMVDHVCRVLDGRPIYAPPAYEHVAFLYHPGFFYLGALFALVTGPGFLAVRLLSVLATIGTCALVFRLARRDGGPVGGLVAVTVFLAAFSLTGCYYDVGRIDPLFTFLLLLGVELTRTAKGLGGYAAATGAFLLCWLTKQTAAVIVPFVVLGCLPRGLRPAALFGGTVAACCVLSSLLLDWLHDGWMWYFTVELPRNHGVLPVFILGYWTHDLLPLAPAIGLWILFVLRHGVLRERVFHGCWILGCVIGSYFSRLHVGGAENVLIPVAAALSVGCGLGIAPLLLRGGATSSMFGGIAPLGSVAALAPLLAVLQAVVLFALPWFGRPLPAVPSPERRALADKQFAALRAQPGPVFVPWHGFTARMAGKPPTAHTMAMDDVWRSGNRRVAAMLDAAIRERLQREPHPVILVDDVGHPQLRGLILGAGYRVVPEAQLPPLPPLVGSALWPKVVLQR